MKIFWPNIACSALFLSGCMYGSGSAPITALNQGSGQYLSPNAATGQWQSAPQPQQPYVNYPVSRYPEQPNAGQTIALTPIQVNPNRMANAPVTPVHPVRPPRTPEVVGNAGSPYTEPARASVNQPPNTAQNDGWAVEPQQPTQSQPIPTRETTDSSPSNVQAVRPTHSDARNHTSADTSSTTSSNDQTTPSTNEQVASAKPPQQPTQPTKGETAVSALLKKASASLGKGDLDSAAAYLENAQRIEPQNAKILYDIANIRYHQGRYKDAENFAGRAVQVGGGNSMMKKSWALVANARKSLGDNQGAIAAAEKAASY